MKAFAAFLSVGLLTVAASCTSTPRHASVVPETWNLVRVGMTAAEVSEVLGEPAVSQLRSGHELWTDEKEWILCVAYDTNGVVTEVAPTKYLGDRSSMTARLSSLDSWSAARGLGR